MIFPKMKELLKDNRGFSNTVEMMFGIIPLIILGAVILGICASIKTQATLDTFADELADKVSMVGKCEDADIQKRFEELKNSTGLSPVMEITADEFVSGSTRRVQYGDAIYVKLILDIPKIGIGDFAIPFIKPHEASRICQSEQYWK